MGRTARPPNFATSRIVAGTYALLVVVGELDLASAPWLRDGLTAIVEMDVAVVVVDLENVTFVAAAGLSPLIEAKQTMHVRDGRLTLVCSNAWILELLDITRLRGYFRVYGSVAQAISHERPHSDRWPLVPLEAQSAWQ